MITVSLRGEPQATATLNRHHEVAAIIGRWRVAVGASAPYARYVHEGTRFMVGRPFLAQALAAVRPRLAMRVDQAIPRGPAAVETALDTVQREVMAEARRRVPVRTGRLRASIYQRIGPRR